ncbi:MAG: CapA family protein [Bacteroidales bacterium]|nr:CapA family protein [Bacteroidales bacterium]
MVINFLGDFVMGEKWNPRVDNRLADFLVHSTFNVINVEAPILPPPITNRYTQMEKSGPSLWQSPKGIALLKENNIHVVSLANNHIMDYGDQGLAQTKMQLSNFIIGGAGNWSEAYQPIILTGDGAKIGILCLTHHEFGTLSDEWDKRYSTGTAWVNHPQVDNVIIETRKAVDYLFVYVHAGVEHTEHPLPEWRDRYRSFVRLGADAVIASHPHVPQGWETYCGSPIIYSLGNFYFPKTVKKQPLWYINLCASFSLTDKGLRFSIRPLIFDNDSISFDMTEPTSSYLMKLNDILVNNSSYMEYINTMCTSKAPTYDPLFAASGYVKWESPKTVIRSLVKKFVGKKENSVHFRNNFCCESHRWLLARAMKLKGKYQ